MVRSLLAADRSSWVVGLLVGWVVVRRELVWPVVGSVVVAVDIGTWNLLEGWMEGPAAQTADRLVAVRAWKIPLAGDAFRALGSPISHRGDHGAVCHAEPESGGENPGRTAGFDRAEGWGREWYPIGR